MLVKKEPVEILTEFFEGPFGDAIDGGSKTFAFSTVRSNLFDLNTFMLNNLLALDFNVVYLSYIMPWVTEKEFFINHPMLKPFNINKLNNMMVIDCLLPKSDEYQSHFNLVRPSNVFSLTETLRTIPVLIKRKKESSSIPGPGVLGLPSLSTSESFFIIIDDISPLLFKYSPDNIYRFIRYLGVFTRKYKNLYVMVNMGYDGKKNPLRETKEFMDATHRFKF